MLAPFFQELNQPLQGEKDDISKSSLSLTSRL